MNKENVKNVIILKNLPSNLIDEAIMVVKDKKKVKNIDTSNLIKDGGENFSTLNDKQVKNRAIQGYMREEDLKNIEKIKKEDRKYVIKEAEMVIGNFLSKIEKEKQQKSYSTRQVELKYKRLKLITVILSLIIVVNFILTLA